MSLLEKLRAAGSVKSETLDNSSLFNEKESIPTDIPIINVALSGKIDGGITSGLGVIAGESKRFKSLLGLIQMKFYLEKYPDAVGLFYDSEFGVTKEYVTALGIDSSRIIHIPIEHIEQLKFDIAKRLDEIKRGDKVFVFVDSIGLLASKKEAEDALAGKDATDMTRAKQLKSVFRIIVPHFTTKDICGVIINHVYKEQGSMYPKDIVSGGQGVMLASNWVWIIGKSQEKDEEGIKGWNFTINVEKSRFVKEKAKLSFLVTYEGGLNRWSGLMDEALDSGHCIKPKNGWYQRAGEEKNYRLADTDNREFWLPILKKADFQDFIMKKYQLSKNTLFNTKDFADDGGDNE
jgi:RecA/RadA recombinase